MEIVVQPGSIIVNEITLVIDHPQFKVYEVDLKSKYPDRVSYAGTEEDLAVLIWANYATEGTDSKYVDRSGSSSQYTADPTIIEFRFDKANEWAIIADAARYTLRIAMWDNRIRPSDDLHQDLMISLEQMRCGDGIDVDPKQLREQALAQIKTEQKE